MNRVNAIGIIFRKEFRDIFRDKRTVFSVVISPILLTPLLLAGMGTVISGQREKAKTETYAVGIVRAERAPLFINLLEKAPNFRFEKIRESEAERKIKDRALVAVVVPPDDADARMQESRAVAVKVMLDAGSDKSRSAYTRLQLALDTAGKQLLTQRLQMMNLPTDFATPFQVSEQPIKSGGGGAMLILAAMLPYVLAISAFSGALYAANDQVAGEKERGTLETLLVSPASRRDIVLGKFLAVAGVCLVSSLLSIVGLMIPFFSGHRVFAWLSQGGVTLSPPAILVTLLTQFPLAVLFAGLLLALSTFARNQKEAQSYQAPLLILVLFPSMMSMFIGADASPTLALVPVLNATLIIKQALSGSFNPLFIGIAFAASIVYAGLALAFATRLFQKEEVLVKA